ncbi:sn-glycerol-3-phosphate ABC transporter ATP-binding protein UgpC [Ralstonia insidiosa]|uniref:Sugar ABC transporter ATP-binding protein n=1 Tax=Ralstonia insidiosa TaxID=190721 RepID=A0A192A3Y5_9RALS|nr:sn-glycerol-3-phosphate ABC transporter ATP-binding protein UgpC [Ralstonia insidiosa]ANJ75099.1 sugar ABC transporter ATP-binding protein [Ralstonia insidiosa]KAB0468171.1 sn-glycerol-3-phosphate ABC transporter ATP-binding protein UgpC [Ralstonia insidiosa]MBY4910869.1 sn-glycerol-3-phosphate ABC transporter ATP-binding protein UgpC [Ralstonia insidiosa]
MASVTLDAIDKRFGDQHIIKNVSVDIRDGEFCVLVGPSGSGKSTLLRIIAGLEEVSGGTVRIGGRDVTQLHPKERDIAMVFQSYALYPQLTVRENMGFSLKLAKRPKAEIDAIVNEIARSLALDKLLDRYPRQLSGGQRQRVAMGRAIVRKPSVFLFDEPLSNLDAALRHHVRAEIREMYERMRTTCVYVTHDQVEAMTLADRIVVLRDGRVEQVGTPVELYDRPVNRFVAQFIGSPAINFFEGVAKVRGDQAAIRCAEGIEIALPDRAPVHDGQEIVCGVRPEHIRIGADDGAQDIRVNARVKSGEFYGAETLLVCDTPVGALAATGRDRQAYGLQHGAQASLSIPAAHLHLFDRTTELRLN